MRGLLFFLAVLGGCSSAAVYYPTLVTVDSRDTGLFSADALRRVGTATGSRDLIAKLP